MADDISRVGSSQEKSIDRYMSGLLGSGDTLAIKGRKVVVLSDDETLIKRETKDAFYEMVMDIKGKVKSLQVDSRTPLDRLEQLERFKKKLIAMADVRERAWYQSKGGAVRRFFSGLENFFRRRSGAYTSVTYARRVARELGEKIKAEKNRRFQEQLSVYHRTSVDAFSYLSGDREIDWSLDSYAEIEHDDFSGDSWDWGDRVLDYYEHEDTRGLALSPLSWLVEYSDLSDARSFKCGRKHYLPKAEEREARDELLMRREESYLIYGFEDGIDDFSFNYLVKVGDQMVSVPFTFSKDLDSKKPFKAYGMTFSNFEEMQKFISFRETHHVTEDRPRKAREMMERLPKGSLIFCGENPVPFRDCMEYSLLFKDRKGVVHRFECDWSEKEGFVVSTEGIVFESDLIGYEEDDKELKQHHVIGRYRHVESLKRALLGQRERGAICIFRQVTRRRGGDYFFTKRFFEREHVRRGKVIEYNQREAFRQWFSYRRDKLKKPGRKRN